MKLSNLIPLALMMVIMVATFATIDLTRAEAIPYTHDLLKVLNLN